ncbi:glycine zipper 2TM domain-containing protein [Flavisolibacter sp. BT320]|nr:glycine zipper 2TM domain-containing protein [Flavisolibacter longurius]
MKLFYTAICLSLLTASCKDSSQTTETTPLLKSDTSFVVGPELPQKDSQAAATTTPVQQEQAPAPVRKKATTVAKATDSQGNTSAATEETGSTTQPAAEEPAKKGWSKTAKGAVVGGVVGAGAGAIINKKNRAAGAVIGGIVGAGAGAVVGNEMDKKDGRH